MRIQGKSIEESFNDPRVVLLTNAACSGDIEGINQLVKAGVDVNTRGAYGLTPLVWAVLAHSHTGMERLLDLGADPNLKLDNGSTVVWWAAGGNDKRTLELLLTHGGNPNVWSDAKNALILTIEQCE